MCPGAPRTANSSRSTPITPRLVMLLATSSDRHSRVNSSSTVRILSRRPSAVWSLMKSYVQTWSIRSARRRTTPFSAVPSRLRLIVRRGTRRWCRRQSRCTRSRPARKPSRASIAWIRLYPYRGCFLASASIAATSGRSASGLVCLYRCVDRGCPAAAQARRCETPSVRAARVTPSRIAAGLSLFPSSPPG